MKAIIDLIENMVAPRVILNTLQKQDPDELGLALGDMTVNAFNNEFNRAASKKIRSGLVPWLDRFYCAYRKRIYGD